MVPLSTWHEGEVALQRTVGVAEHLARHGPRVIRDHMPEPHREFFGKLPFVVAGAVDPAGDVWATVLAGKTGFLQSSDPLHLNVTHPRDPTDPADPGMNDGDAIALLGIELHTRRRNRMNGTLRRQDATAFDVQVEQSFGNCPQYIQLRDFAFVRDPDSPASAPARTLTTLDARTREIVTSADTFFVASYVDGDDGHRQIDVSHRGGRPGFVRVDAGGVLTIPDFSGNKFFNTLGNLVVNPKAGLVFIDFESGDLLQLTGRAAVILDSPEIAVFRGAERLWRVTPHRVVHRGAALPLRWSFEPEGWSPNSLATGHW
jgi:predicted pyridoxine 5'-phosphate oxidase superfamily flavin-nucleotide-binding protein